MAEEKKVSVEVSNISESESLKSNENSSSSFYKWDEYREPIEIKCPGKYVLSDTENGKSIVFYDPDFFEEDKASALMDLLLNSTNWQAKNVTIRGVEYRQPRLVAWYGPFPYSYSGSTLEPAEMPFYIFQIKKKIEKYLRKNGVNVKLNSVLLNRYRNHKDSVSWHSDDESSMGIFPTIASVSLGETRRFEMRRKLKFFGEESSYTESDDYFILLNNGSLLIMDGSMQKDWQHRVPKEYCPKEERINLTFRTVYKVEKFLRSPKSQIKRSLERLTKVHRKKNSYGETLDFDAESDGSVTESNKLAKNNSQLSLKVEDNSSEDAESKSALERVTNTQGENSSFHKTLDIDVKPEGSGAVGKIEDFQSAIERKKPVENNTKSSFKIEVDVCEEDETNSYKDFTLKTEEIWIESSDEDDDIIEIPYRKRRTSLDAKKDVKNIGKTDSTTQKNKRICVSRQSSATNSSNITVQKDFKMKTESTCKADSRQTLIESCENNTFDSCELKDLLKYNVDIMNCKLFLNYANALKNQILQNIDKFSLPSKAELEVLCELMHGSQTEDSKKIITRRMLSIIHKALKLPQGSSEACSADSRQTLTESCENDTSGFLRSSKSQIKRSLEKVTKVHRKKISYGETLDSDAESDGSVTERNKPEKNNSQSSLKIRDSACEDAESERALEQVTNTQGEISSFQKTININLKSEGTGTVAKIENFRSAIESKKPEGKKTKSSFKIEGEVCGDDETNSYKHFTLKTEILNESDEDDDIIEISYRKRRNSLDAKKGVKNIGKTNATTGRNKRICITINSLNNTMQKDFKIKTEST